jgi:hypothetical protein
MKVLKLIIKRKYFDQIVAGTKKQEFRDIKPSTEKKYIQIDKDGYALNDENGNNIPIKYDAIRFYVGYAKNRDTALVEVKGAHSETYVDENGKPVMWPQYGPDYWAERMVYDLGKVINE